MMMDMEYRKKVVMLVKIPWPSEGDNSGNEITVRFKG